MNANVKIIFQRLWRVDVILCEMFAWNVHMFLPVTLDLEQTLTVMLW